MVRQENRRRRNPRPMVAPANASARRANTRAVPVEYAAITRPSTSK